MNMKKKLIILILFMLYGMVGCYNGDENSELESTDNNYSMNEVLDSSDFTNNADIDEEVTQMDDLNRTTIAKALGIEENSRNIRFILNSLNTIHAGQIQRAELSEASGEKVLYIVAEDGTEYRIYLSGNGSVEAVENVATGEWPIRSNR